MSDRFAADDRHAEDRAKLEPLLARDRTDDAVDLGFRVAGYGLLVAVAVALLTGHDEVALVDVGIVALGFGLLAGAASLLQRAWIVTTLIAVTVLASAAAAYWG